MIVERPELIVGNAVSGQRAHSAINKAIDGNDRRANRLRRVPFNPSAKTKLLAADAKLLLEFGQRLERARFRRRRGSGLLANLGEEFGLDRRELGEVSVPRCARRRLRSAGAKRERTFCHVELQRRSVRFRRVLPHDRRSPLFAGGQRLEAQRCVDPFGARRKARSKRAAIRASGWKSSYC